MIDHLDACARALRAAALPCTEYQVWVSDDALVHYWFGYARALTREEAAVSQQILARYLRTA